MKTKVCTSCGYVGKPVRQCFESFLLDAFAWLVFASIAIMTGLFPLMLVPAAWTVYHIARFRSTKCPKCEDLSMVTMRTKDEKDTDLVTQDDAAPSLR